MASSSHSTTGSSAFPADLPAIEDLAGVLDVVTAVGPDGVLMSAGQARLLADIDGRPLPALTVRGDVTNLYLSPDHAESDIVDDAALRAVRLDAAALLINLLDADDDPSVRQACLRNVFAARSACEHFGLALMVEPIPFERRDGRYYDVADEERLVPLVRQAVEAGAQVIKAGILPDERAMRRAIGVCGDVPYLARGGSKGDDVAVLELTRHLLDCGAAGVVFGRNIFQHERPAAMAAALKALIHDDASTEQRRGRAGVSMTRAQLFLLAIDHRRSMERLFGIDEPVGAADRERLVAAKALVAQALGDVVAGRAGDHGDEQLGILVDDEYGAAAIASARDDRGGRGAGVRAQRAAPCSSSSTTTGADRLAGRSADDGQGADPPPCRRRRRRGRHPAGSARRDQRRLRRRDRWSSCSSCSPRSRPPSARPARNDSSSTSAHGW